MTENRLRGPEQEEQLQMDHKKEDHGLSNNLCEAQALGPLVAPSSLPRKFFFIRCKVDSCRSQSRSATSRGPRLGYID